MYRDYIFDLYGTLADIHTDETPDAFWEDTAAFADTFGVSYTGASLKSAYLALCADEVRLRAKTLPDVPEAYIEPELTHVFIRLLKDRDADDPEAGAKRFAAYFRKRSTLHLRQMPYACETLDVLRSRGARTFLLSNAQSCFTRDELDALRLSERFDGILLSSDAGVKKPHPKLFKLLLDRYAIVPETALMVGNDAVADIAGAGRVGLSSAYIHTRQSGRHPKSLPRTCMEIPDLSALLSL